MLTPKLRWTKDRGHPFEDRTPLIDGQESSGWYLLERRSTANHPPLLWLRDFGRVVQAR